MKGQKDRQILFYRTLPATAGAQLVNRSSISNIAKNSDFNNKLAALGTKAELKAEQDKTAKLQTYDLS